MNYEQLGFRSQEELEESIERVKATKTNPKNDLERRAENRARFDTTGSIDYNTLKEGARINELDRVVSNRLYWEQEEQRQKAEQKNMKDIMMRLAEQTKADKEAKADKEIEIATAKAQAELEAKIKKDNNLKSNEDLKMDNAYSEILKSLKLDS